MKNQAIASVMALGITGAVFAGPTAYVVNGQRMYKSTDGGATFAFTGTTSGGGSGLIVGLGYHSNSGTFYATSGNYLYSVAGINSANPTLTRVKDLSTVGSGGTTISFEFFGDTFRGTKGQQIIEFNIVTNSALSILNSATGTGANTPSTGKVGTDYYGMTGSANVYKFDVSGGTGSTFVGATGLTSMNVAGGSGLNGVYYTAAGYSGLDKFLFGTINTTNGLFTQISETSFGGTYTGSMGMTVIDSPIIPLPSGAAMAIVGLGGLSVVRRRRG